MGVSRRQVLAGATGAATLLLAPGALRAQAGELIRRKVPSSGEALPAIGLGTARRYEAVNSIADLAPLRDTVRRFKQVGLTVIDSSPTYGTAEGVVGDLVDELKIRDGLFLATKVSIAGGAAGASGRADPPEGSVLRRGASRHRSRHRAPLRGG